MKNYLKHLEKLSFNITQFFNKNDGCSKKLLLDGTGMLSSYQNASLSILGMKRLQLFDEIHLVSGSSYALFIYLAMLEGQFLWSSKDIALWNKHVRSWHGIVPIVGFIKFFTYRYTGVSAGKFGGHKKACQQFFSTQFLNRQLNTFSEKYYFWVYDLKSKSLRLVNKNNGYGDLTVSDVISMTTSVPSVFGVYEKTDLSLIDAMYAPNFPKFKYDVFKNCSVLHLNMFKNGYRDGIHSLKIHEHQDGNKLIRRDFFRFLLGLKNHEFELVTKYALFGVLT